MLVAVQPQRMHLTTQCTHSGSLPEPFLGNSWAIGVWSLWRHDHDILEPPAAALVPLCLAVAQAALDVAVLTLHRILHCQRGGLGRVFPVPLVALEGVLIHFAAMKRRRPQ